MHCKLLWLWKGDVSCNYRLRMWALWSRRIHQLKPQELWIYTGRYHLLEIINSLAALLFIISQQMSRKKKLCAESGNKSPASACSGDSSAWNDDPPSPFACQFHTTFTIVEENYNNNKNTNNGAFFSRFWQAIYMKNPVQWVISSRQDSTQTCAREKWMD